MSEQTTVAPVRRSVTVAAAPERAFAVFTDGFATWWPSGHSVIAGGYEAAIIEPREGGRWYERGKTGAECDWGRVLAYEPPHRILLSWHLDAEFEVDPEPEHASEVQVTFTAEGDGTRVELEHRHFERHARDGHKVADAVSREGGWGALLDLYAQAAAVR